ncbi:MAG: N-acetylornithine carbamoyltransferase [Planctomycetota bacterium]|nr:N-acetylornithine carbamoyltransferase [Planctomycetota bacterium]
MSTPWHFLSLRDVDTTTWQDLLAQSEILSGPRGREPLLAGRRCGMVFFNPSLRTRTAFEVACGDLGAFAVNLQVGGGLWSLEHRDGVVMDGPHAEHVKEGFAVLARMVDALGLRSFASLADAKEDARDLVLRSAAAASSVPVLSLESAMDHPHQGLADALTVRRKVGERAKVVVTWAPHIKPLPLAVPHAATLAFAQEGHDVVIAHPHGFDLDAGVVADATAIAEAAGGSLSVTHERDAAFEGARVIYAKSWGARGYYGDAQRAAADVMAHPEWIVDGPAMDRTDGGIFMHCLPVRRGVVVADEVLDGPSSVVIDQAAARLDVQKATLCRAMGVTA